MDIQRLVKKAPIWKTYWYVFPIALLVTASIAAKTYLGDTSYVVDRSALQFAQVQRGEFLIEVNGIGQLKPKSTQWISSSVSGRVEQILVKPGSYVSQGDELVRLTNPELLRSLQKSNWELQATEAEMKASLVLLESQLLDLETRVDEAKFNYQSTKLKLDAESQLIKAGKSSISKIEFQRTKLSVDQQKQRWLAEQSRAKKMKDNIAASKMAQLARLELVKSSYQSIQEQVESLKVRARVSGIIQSISLQLGQQILTGESVATIADHSSLIAELKVQELQVQDISIGQQVIVDTRTSEIKGVVTRVDPGVQQGMVQVDVALTEKLPPEARPDLNIEGRIIVNKITDTLFVRRPNFAPRYTEIKLFSLSEDEQFISRKAVKLGINSVSQVQVTSGLSEGEYVVTSDISQFEQHQQILIN
jgi:HlyD family secretion protein